MNVQGIQCNVPVHESFTDLWTGKPCKASSTNWCAWVWWSWQTTLVHFFVTKTSARIIWSWCSDKPLVTTILSQMCDQSVHGLLDALVHDFEYCAMTIHGTNLCKFFVNEIFVYQTVHWMLSPILWHIFVPGVCADLSPVRAQDLEFTNGCLARVSAMGSAMFGTVFFFFKTNLINVVVMSRWPWLVLIMSVLPTNRMNNYPH